MIYAIFQAEPRYAIPFRGFEMLAAITALAALTRWAAARAGGYFHEKSSLRRALRERERARARSCAMLGMTARRCSRDADLRHDTPFGSTPQRGHDIMLRQNRVGIAARLVCRARRSIPAHVTA
ncbi:hypothetical protein [Metallibacterium sp.]|uniref:hypothetical protein n=1 Tax=Metallibacterium sp. TaxID=2940281 RepID=UPI002637D8D6|nr:hypothetical protein [Metallibacterium sp.]